MTPTTPEQKLTLEDRYRAFKCYELPGQPMAAHMGTIYLVNDLYREVTALTKERDEYKQRMQRLMTTLLETKKERDALAADAARYRWMTEHIVSGELETLEKAFTTLEEIESITQAEFDAVIDAAIKAGVK